MTLETEINNQVFVLHCSGAIYWVEKRMLLIADVHLGKISHFRKYGSALPGGAVFKNFVKLNTAVEYFNPERICFLGDLFHSAINNEWHLFSDWINYINIPVVLVAGNHDIINPVSYENIGITVVSEWVLNGFLLTHHPEERSGLFTFAGHIHPAVKLYGFGGQALKMPCFFCSPQQMILPAFGEFTGTYVMRPKKHDKVYAITKDEVVMVNIQ